MKRRAPRFLSLLICVCLLAAACSDDGNGSEEEEGQAEGTEETDQGPVFGSADLEQVVLPEEEAPEGLVFDENASGPLTLYAFVPDEDRQQVASDNGFEAGFEHTWNAPPSEDPTVPAPPVSSLHATNLSSAAVVFSDADGASTTFAFMEENGNPEAVERTSEPVEGIGEEAYSALAVFQDPGGPKLYNYSYQWRVGNVIGLLGVQTPKEAGKGGPSEADLLALAKQIAAQASEEPTGEDLALPPEGTPGEVLFEDDFESEKSGWKLNFPGDPEGSATAYENGKLKLTIDQTDGGGRYNDTGELSKDLAALTDTSMEVDAENAGPDEAGWGLMCREQDDGTFYAFIVSGTGRAFIVKALAPGEPFIFLVASSPSDELATTLGSPHSIRADCLGDETVRLSLFVNDELVMDAFDDDPLPEGAAGLWSESPPEVGAEILYDNFVIKGMAPAQ